MAVSRQSRKQIESGDFAGLEDQWLAKLSENPLDLPYFVGVARALGGNGQDGRARDLLEILDDHLVGENAWEPRLVVLQDAGPLLFPDDGLHPAILDTLRKLHPESPSRDGLMELVGLHRAVDDIPKTWEKVDRFRTLMGFEVGSVVWMKDKGAGRVVEVNLGLQKLKIDFEEHPSLAVGLKAAGKLLRPVPTDHFLRRKLEQPEELRELAKKEPSRLLQLVLESQEEPMNATAVRKSVAGLVPDGGWSSWWSAAKSHPQLVAAGKGARQTYRLAASETEATDQILDTFRSRDLKAQIDIFRREAKRDASLRQAMSDELAEHGRAIAGSDPATAISIWLALEKSGTAPKDEDWSPQTLIREAKDPAGWIAVAADRALRVYAGRVVKEVRPDRLAVFGRWLRRETDPRVLAQLTAEIGKEGPGALESFFDDVLAKPRKHPEVFVWLLESIDQNSHLEGRNPLRLLQQTLEAPGQSEFSGLRARLKNLIESGESLAAHIASLEAYQAEQAEELFRRAPLEDYVRERLVTAIELRFPDLRSSESDALYATAQSIGERRKELKRLLEEEIPANRRAIEEARALGDLRENFEYKSARQRHEYLSARVSALEADLHRVQPIDLASVDTGSVRVGTVVSLSGSNGTTRSLTLLGPWESDPERGVISYQSETAQKMLGKKVGDAIDLDDDTWTVAAIEPA